MKHLKLFESFENLNKEYFKDKIDWKLYNLLNDLCLKYTDQGSYAYICISTILGNENNFTENERIYTCVYNEDAEDAPIEFDMNLDDIGVDDILYPNDDYAIDDTFEYNKKYYESNGILVYTIQVSQGEPKAEEWLHHIKTILSKYNPIVKGNNIVIFTKNNINNNETY